MSGLVKRDVLDKMLRESYEDILQRRKNISSETESGKSAGSTLTNTTPQDHNNPKSKLPPDESNSTVKESNPANNTPSGIYLIKNISNSQVIDFLQNGVMQNGVRLRYGKMSAIRTAKKIADNKKIDERVSVALNDSTTKFDDKSATLDGDTASQNQSQMTELDKRLAEMLISYGILNHWQSTQLWEGRTKFTLGNYWIINAIGKGGYGHVFLGCEYHKDSQNSIVHPPKILPTSHADYKPPVALKVLPIVKSTADLSERFLKEIKLQRRLKHPNLVRFIDAGHDGNVDFMVHEYVDGGDVRTLLHHEGVIAFDIAAAIIADLAYAVQYLHDQGIVHRDIKPANILLSRNGNVKLIDLGFSLEYDINRYNSKPIEASLDESSSFDRELDKLYVGKIAGTIDYVAPDQIRKPNEPSPAWDIYSIGCSFYQLLTGTVPFPKGDTKQKLTAHINTEPTDPRVLNQTIPFHIAELVLTMLHKDPTKRIQTAIEIAEKLEPWIPPDRLNGQLI
ncbi:MAG: serine/threonine protein kinase [Planctomycetaceae bacterium]|jgi:hypothetical protein|nr:serine/threonine protein kinase [Planctomycetaceae bacterium]